MLYQLSHFRSNDATTSEGGAESQDRTGDTAIFSRVLYQLSYLGPMANQALAARRRPEGYHGASRRFNAATGEGWSGGPLRATTVVPESNPGSCGNAGAVAASPERAVCEREDRPGCAPPVPDSNRGSIWCGGCICDYPGC